MEDQTQQRIRRHFSNILATSIGICRSNEAAKSPICIKPDSTSNPLPTTFRRQARPRLSDLFSADSDDTTTRCCSTKFESDKISSWSGTEPDIASVSTSADVAAHHIDVSCVNIVIELQLECRVDEDKTTSFQSGSYYKSCSSHSDDRSSTSTSADVACPIDRHINELQLECQEVNGMSKTTSFQSDSDDVIASSVLVKLSELSLQPHESSVTEADTASTSTSADVACPIDRHTSIVNELQLECQEVNGMSKTTSFQSSVSSKEPPEYYYTKQRRNRGHRRRSRKLKSCNCDSNCKSVAVAKRSVDPYSDFKRSMMEMIVKKEMFGTEELEELLLSFLSLNSVEHHKTIVLVFVDILRIMFSDVSE